MGERGDCRVLLLFFFWYFFFALVVKFHLTVQHPVELFEVVIILTEIKFVVSIETTVLAVIIAIAVVAMTMVALFPFPIFMPVVVFVLLGLPMLIGEVPLGNLVAFHTRGWVSSTEFALLLVCSLLELSTVGCLFLLLVLDPAKKSLNAPIWLDLTLSEFVQGNGKGGLPCQVDLF